MQNAGAMVQRPSAIVFFCRGSINGQHTVFFADNDFCEHTTLLFQCHNSNIVLYRKNRLLSRPVRHLRTFQKNVRCFVRWNNAFLREMDEKSCISNVWGIHFEKGLVFSGPGDTGKSQIMLLLEMLLSKRNNFAICKIKI
jgi:hypothetical protein